MQNHLDPEVFYSLFWNLGKARYLILKYGCILLEPIFVDRTHKMDFEQQSVECKKIENELMDILPDLGEEDIGRSKRELISSIRKARKTYRQIDDAANYLAFALEKLKVMTARYDGIAKLYWSLGLASKVVVGTGVERSMAEISQQVGREDG